MVLLMLVSQYILLCTLSVLLLTVAPAYETDPKKYKWRARFLLVTLHFLHVWVFVVASLTSLGGFCISEKMYPRIVYMSNGLFMIVFVIIVILTLFKYKLDSSKHDDKNFPMYRQRRGRFLYTSIWCALLTLIFLATTTLVFNETDKLKCSKDGEHFLYKDCKFSTFIHFIACLATIHCSAVIRVVFFRNIR